MAIRQIWQVRMEILTSRPSLRFSNLSGGFGS